MVGYSEEQISRLEKNQRRPDLTALKALFIPALHIEDEPQFITRFLELANPRGRSPDLRQGLLLIKVYCSLTNGTPNYSLDGKLSRLNSLIAYQISPLAHLPASWLSWVHLEVASHRSSARDSRSHSNRQAGMFVASRPV